MLKVRLIGKFGIEYDGKPLTLSSRIGQSIFAYLIMTAGVSHRREKLAGMFWPEESEERARTYLRQEIWRIRNLFPDPLKAEYFLADKFTIGFNPTSSHWLDVAAFREVSDKTLADELIAGLAFYQGELLPGFYEDWVISERGHLQAIFETKMARLLEMLETEHRWRELIEWAEHWISFGQVPEAAYRALMVAYTALEDPARVTLAYQRCVQALREMDLEPSDETRALALKRISRLNIPIPLTSFIGREKELNEIAGILSDSRLVTLTGSGGVGKTRLAIQVVAEVLDFYPDGVFFLDLAQLTDPGLLPDTLSGILGLHASGKLSLTEVLTHYFHSRTALIIFDNCEHLIEACARLINSLLTSCPTLSILATSREVLRVPGEHTFRVPSLEVPESDPKLELSDLMKIESVRLFIERAARNAPGLDNRREDILSIAQICRKLDGIPLAIELAAARVNLLTVGQILERLNDRFSLLTGGLRTSLPRHQTLRAMIEWSYELLSEKEQLLFRRLAVFLGGWTLEAAEEVCSGTGIEANNILGLLSELVNKSLVMVEAGRGETRYHRLETIRQFAWEKFLESTEATGIRDRHLAFFLHLAAKAEMELRGPDDIRWLDKLETEHGNCRAALGWALESPGIDRQVALQFSSALRDFWTVHGHGSEGFRWLTEALRHAGDLPTVDRCKALCGLAMLPTSPDQRAAMGALLDEALPLAHHLQMPDLILEALYYSITKYGNNLLDDAEETRKRSEECIALAHLAGNRFFLVFILGFRSWYIIHDAHEWMQSTREAYQVALELGNARALSEALAGLGHMYRSQGQYEKATLAVKECLRLSKELGDKYEEVWFHWALSNIENQKGDLTLGQQYAEEGLLLARDLSDPLYTSYTLLGLGWNAYLRGDYGQARRCLEESLAIRREPGVMSFILSPLICLGRVALAQGEEEEARTFFREALELFTLTSKYWLLADCLERMSGLSSLSAEAAARLLGSAEAMRAREGTLIPASERATYGTFVEKVRTRLGEEAFQAAWSEGGRMSSPETAAFAARCLDAGESDRLQNSPQQTSQLDHPVGPGAFGEGQDHDL